MRVPSRVLTAGSAVLATVAIAACGSSTKGFLSASQKSTLSGHLEAISTDVQAGDCIKARAEADAFNNAVAALPSSVSSTLVSNLGQGASTIKSLTAHCGAGNATTSSTTTTVTETSSTATVTAVATTPSTTSTGNTGNTGAGDTGNTANTGNPGSGSTGSTGAGSTGSGNTGNTGNTGAGSTGGTGAGSTGSGNTGNGGAGLGGGGQ